MSRDRDKIALYAKQIDVKPLRFTVIALLVTAAAIAASLALGSLTPFNEQYEYCEADQAEWKLIVECSAGSSGEPEYEAYYRKRTSPLPEHCWAMPLHEDEVGCVEYFCGGTSWAILGCGCGEGGGIHTFESCTLNPIDTAKGVDIAVDYERSENSRELEATKGIMSLRHSYRPRTFILRDSIHHQKL